MPNKSSKKPFRYGFMEVMMYCNFVSANNSKKLDMDKSVTEPKAILRRWHKLCLKVSGHSYGHKC